MSRVCSLDSDAKPSGNCPMKWLLPRRREARGPAVEEKSMSDVNMNIPLPRTSKVCRDVRSDQYWLGMDPAIALKDMLSTFSPVSLPSPSGSCPSSLVLAICNSVMVPEALSPRASATLVILLLCPQVIPYQLHGSELSSKFQLL